MMSRMVTDGRARVGFVMLLASTGAVAFACSSSSSETPKTSNDAGGGEPDGEAIDAAVEDSAADAGDSGWDGRFASVIARSDTFSGDTGPKGFYRVGAIFGRPISPDTTVTSKTVGPCVVSVFGQGDQRVDQELSAGVVRLEVGTKTINLTPDSKNSYDFVDGTEPLWSGGETVTARGDGKDVPAFTVPLVAPSKVTVTAPALVPKSITVNRSAGMMVTFSGASSGEAELHFVAVDDKAYEATCTFALSGGTAQVPAAAFADFPAGPGTMNFDVKTTGATVTAGWNVVFTARTSMATASGVSLQQQDVTFQ